MSHSTPTLPHGRQPTWTPNPRHGTARQQPAATPRRRESGCRKLWLASEALRFIGMLPVIRLILFIITFIIPLAGRSILRRPPSFPTLCRERPPIIVIPREPG